MTRIEIFTEASKIANENNQVVGEDNDLYITLEQLMRLLMTFEDSRP